MFALNIIDFSDSEMSRDYMCARPMFIKLSINLVFTESTMA